MVVRVFSRLVVCAAACAVLSGCRNEEPPRAAKATAAPAAARETSRAGAGRVVAGGEVSLDSAPPAEVWLTDANLLALLKTIASRQIAADNVELQTWHSDTIRDFAITMVREHASIGRAVDSLATRIKLPPVAPALAAQIFAQMQARTDTLSWQRGMALDRAYVRHQVSSNEAASRLAAQLAAVAERPEVQALAQSVAERNKAAAARARALDAQLVAADSVRADSIAKAQERRKRPKPAGDDSLR